MEKFRPNPLPLLVLLAAEVLGDPGDPRRCHGCWNFERLASVAKSFRFETVVRAQSLEPSAWSTRASAPITRRSIQPTLEAAAHVGAGAAIRRPGAARRARRPALI
jgi:hypothetical protein